MSEMVELSKKAEQPIDKFVRVAAVLEEHELKAQVCRRSTTEDKTAIDKYVDGLDGQLASMGDFSIGDILAAAGVRKNQGTSGYARRAVKRKLLTYKPTASQT